MDSRVVTTKLRLPKPVVDLAGRAVGEILVAQGVVSREKVDEASQELVKLVPINFAKQARLLPLRIDTEGERQAVVALADPLDTGTLDSVRLLLDAPIAPLLVPSQAILDCINLVYDRAANEAEQLVGDLEAGDLDTVAHELEEPQDLLDS